MTPTPAVCFGPYRLAGPRGPLWRGEAEIPLRAKTLEVLWYLAKHPGEVVEHDRLLAEVWRKTVVGVGTLAVSIGELRRILGDDAKAPVYIQTLHRRGYRFIAPVASAIPGAATIPAIAAPSLLGREAELARLRDCYDEVCRGRRRILFVTGEAGIGKSTLVDAWIRWLNDPSISPSIPSAEIWLGRGQCVEHSGAGEPYLAMLEALNRLCRGPRGETVIAHLRQQAPGWLAQLSGVLTPPEREAMQHRQAPVNTHHYQRELADALEAIAATRPLVLFLEDLQWCDQATVEALAVLARRPEAARILVIGTCRPIELTRKEHPLKTLKDELQWHGQSREIALRGLDEAAVRTYVASRLPPETAGSAATLVHRRTAGQPLFMVKLTEYLLEHPELAGAGTGDGLDRAAATLPTDLQQFIEVQIERLDTSEQRVLEAASVAGPVFAVAAVAAALDLSEAAVDAVCEGLARREQLVAVRGPVEWPDGTLTETYAFRHALYQEVLYWRVASSRRVRLHRAIGARLEAGYGTEGASIAVELAEHFERGHDDRRAARYHRLAGETALTRFAAAAAQVHLRRGLALLARWPQDTERGREELKLQIALGVAAIATDGFGAPAVAYAYGRAHALCRQFPKTPTLLPVLCGLWNYFVTRADLQQARSLARELAEVIEGAQTSECLLPARNAVGQTDLFTGELARARVQVDAERLALNVQTRQHLVAEYGEDPAVVREMYAALLYWLLGSPEQASIRIETGLRLARELAQPFGVAQILWTRMLLAHGVGDPVRVQSEAQGLIEHCKREEIAVWLAGARILRGWALAEQGEPAAGIVSIRLGLEEWGATGAVLIRPYYLARLAEAYAKSGYLPDALDTVAEALAAVERTGERWYEAELHRLQAELRWQKGDAPIDEVEAGLCRALTLAREQQARALELRAGETLARFLTDQGRPEDTARLLASSSDDCTAGCRQAHARGMQTTDG
ncbi:AAA family ATPase [Thiocapsa roseopersicina]|uniref:Transcriptional regulatory protein, C terminal n=1 Tax=Thiocapsa roseopersicina TaxID=1058 RepID=A0A1H3AW39_THIRO|nr:AAA family ATPase [Thiocapsa roseopersicina]SDX33926.1 Transcriptional regulatory protein, C terminal [Thiocapsa roseopersicina]